jgi:hypothetical protein
MLKASWSFSGAPENCGIYQINLSDGINIIDDISRRKMRRINIHSKLFWRSHENGVNTLYHRFLRLAEAPE